MKQCASCKQLKPLDEFSPYRDRRYSYCKPCSSERTKAYRKADPEKARAVQRRANIKMKYGLDWVAYEALAEKQSGRCAICGDEFKTGKGGVTVDHDHDTGAVRGLLCSPCNIMLGAAKDDATRLRAAIRYLEEV